MGFFTLFIAGLASVIVMTASLMATHNHRIKFDQLIKVY
ncbi:hypothetical protein D1BOALGB6SA_7043 [Olavius sp. associated proteobacterium Delta 1]|nr:hypothetical protein D1BOALGB6SA_7043 [Olavius sp. associated proteobacterium Delta 1]